MDKDHTVRMNLVNPTRAPIVYCPGEKVAYFEAKEMKSVKDLAGKDYLFGGPDGELYRKILTREVGEEWGDLGDYMGSPLSVLPWKST